MFAYDKCVAGATGLCDSCIVRMHAQNHTSFEVQYRHIGLPLAKLFGALTSALTLKHHDTPRNADGVSMPPNSEAMLSIAYAPEFIAFRLPVRVGWTQFAMWRC